jgi:hypothetical protein
MGFVVGHTEDAGQAQVAGFCGKKEVLSHETYSNDIQ